MKVFFFCVVTNGVYLEKWEKIDYKRIRFLLEDPRYPNLPSFSTCIPTFEQPSNWGDFFGSRLRTYFVPFQTGDHYFFLCKKFLQMIIFSLQIQSISEVIFLKKLWLVFPNFVETLTTTTKNVTNATSLAIERVQKALLVFFIHTIFIIHLKFFYSSHDNVFCFSF